jgi:FkbM family methyltransferase
MKSDVKADHTRQLTQGITPKLGLLRRLTAGPVRALGYEPIPIWNLSTYAHDYVHANLMRVILEKKQINCVFDVGAFNGHYGRFLREKVGFEGTILSFEPLPGPYGILADSAQNDPNWHVFPWAMGNERGKFEMNVMRKLWFSSLLKPSAETPAAYAPQNTEVDRITVTVETIAAHYDEFAQKYGFKRPFLKMDTQGYDLKVVEGAGSKLEHFQGLQSELALVHCYEGMPDWRDAIAVYEKAGFAISAFSPLDNFPSGTDEKMRAVEIDCVMVRVD